MAVIAPWYPAVHAHPVGTSWPKLLAGLEGEEEDAAREASRFASGRNRQLTQ